MTSRNVTSHEAKRLGADVSSTLHSWAGKGLVTSIWRIPSRRGRWDIPDLERQLDVPPITTKHKPVLEPTARLGPTIVTSNLGVLIERRHDSRPLWTFPAGEAEPGESPADTAIRETKEETGLQVVVSHAIGERQHPKTGRHMIYLAARPFQGTVVHVGDEDELAEVKWASLAEAVELMPGMFEPVHEHLVHARRK